MKNGKENTRDKNESGKRPRCQKKGRQGKNPFKGSRKEDNAHIKTSGDATKDTIENPGTFHPVPYGFW